MSIKISTNFLLSAQLPLDDRTVVANITARNAIPTIQRYDGLLVYEIDTNINWQLQGGILDANWVQIGSGSSTGNKSMAIDAVTVLQEGDDVIINLDTLTYQYSEILSVLHNGIEMSVSNWEKLSDTIRIFNENTGDEYMVMYLYNASGISKEGLTGVQSGASVTLDLTQLKYTVGSIFKLTRNGKGLVPADYVKVGNTITVTTANSSDTFSILYNYTSPNLTFTSELLTGTQSGSDVLLDLTGLSHSYKNLLFIDRNGKTIYPTGYIKTGDTVHVLNANVADNFIITYNY